jgi:HlyD family secretion protein
MKRLFSVLFFAALVAMAIWMIARRSSDPEVGFVKAARETLTSTLTTNGKVEPVEWSEIRALREGRLESLRIEPGRTVTAGAVVASIAAPEAAADLSAAEARVQQTRAEQTAIGQGGKAREFAEIDGSIAKLEKDREAAARDISAIERLVEKKAATAQELRVAKDQIVRLDAEIGALRVRRKSLVEKTDETIAAARLKDAEAALALASRKLGDAVVRAPAGGTIYDVTAREGAWLSPGDLIAKVGKLEQLRIRIFVDEPELGRVKTAQPVTITWDGLPGRKWQATVQTMPSSVVTVGTRQVGEVIVLAQNPGRDLPPGANINAEIRTAIVENALVVPKETLRRNANGFGVFVLEGDRLAWRVLTLGASSMTKAEVISGLSDGDSIALPSEGELKAGITVKPVYR